MSRRLDQGAHVVVATHNPGKLIEIAALLRPWRLVLTAAATAGLPEPEETEPDLAGNARLKATQAAHAAGLPALADDSGFCLAALDGAPGVHSARWAGPDRDFAAAMQRVHDQAAHAMQRVHDQAAHAMQRVHDQAAHDPDTRAWFACALCLAWPDGTAATFLGRADGHWTWPPRGGGGFGYDPIFIPAGETRTYGEMTGDEKHRDSHRTRAFAQLAAACLPTPHP